MNKNGLGRNHNKFCNARNGIIFFANIDILSDGRIAVVVVLVLVLTATVVLIAGTDKYSWSLVAV